MTSVIWNPWHGCHKLSEGCRHCYVYREDTMRGTAIAPSVVRKTRNFDLPLHRDRYGLYKASPGTLFYTCFTSDFFIEEADEWRHEAWQMMRKRSDLTFLIITKRIDRFHVALPDDWGDGYPNVAIGCTVENQDRADYRIPIFLSLPIRHKSIMAAPLLESINLSAYLATGMIEEVSASGESGMKARTCDYRWVLDLRRQCIEAHVDFDFHQTGSHLLKDGRLYVIPRCHQIAQARRAGIDTNNTNDTRI